MAMMKMVVGTYLADHIVSLVFGILEVLVVVDRGE
jgi:hypothetical protein